jgi:hypothetical protein
MTCTRTVILATWEVEISGDYGLRPAGQKASETPISTNEKLGVVGMCLSPQLHGAHK